MEGEEARVEGAGATSAPEMSKTDNNSTGQKKKPTCIIVLGMAGSGKTTFVQVCVIILTSYKNIC